MSHDPPRLVTLALRIMVGLNTQKRWWMVTIPIAHFNLDLLNDHSEFTENICYLRGQQEQGETGYHHWQMVLYLKNKKRFNTVRLYFHDSAHIEPVDNIDAALDYVWKDDTHIIGTKFEHGNSFILRLLAYYENRASNKEEF